MSAIDTGDTSWVLASTALVMIMTPGVGFFYGGLVNHTNILTTITQSFITFAVVSLLWFFLGFSLVFGPSSNDSGFLGDLTYGVLENVGMEPHSFYATTCPFIVFFFFQLTFAAITPALISGAISTRIKLSSFTVFVIAWSILVYAPIGHWVWNEKGWALKLGAIDFAGGFVVHTSSGFAALAGALVIGKRHDQNEAKPANIPLVLIGTVLSWFGWYGFNGGSALGANALAGYACASTNMAAVSTALAWMACEYIFEKKTSIVGFAVGCLTGLVVITPGAGFVTVWASVVIGLLGAPICYSVSRITKKYKVFDDALGAFCCHGVGGAWGTISTGLFATKSINSAGPDGAFYGNGDLLWKQIVVFLASAAWSFVISLILLLIIKKVMGLRVSLEAEIQGLDKVVLKEEALSFEEGALFSIGENTMLAANAKAQDGLNFSELKSPSTALISPGASFGELGRLRRVHVEPIPKKRSSVKIDEESP